MPKVVKSYPRIRVAEHPNQGLQISSDGSLVCSVCNKSLDAEKASTVKTHFEGKKHQDTLKAAGQTTSATQFCAKKDVWKDMVESFLHAGVSIGVFSNEKVRTWIKTNVKIGNTLPAETSLRRIVKDLGAEDEALALKIFRDKDVIVMTDETTDVKNRKILNVLMAPAEPKANFRLVSTKFLNDGCTAAIIAHAVSEGIMKMKVEPDRVICFKSDNAPTMVSAGRTLKGLYPRMIHSTCWSHVLHLLGEEIRTKFKTADSYVASFKAALTKAPSRRSELLDTFEKHGCVRKLPPVPVITRWGTWLEAGNFHFNNYEAELKWIQVTEDDSAAVHKLKDLVKNPELKQELQKISEICPTITSTIRTLERNGLPASDVWLLLQTVHGALHEVFETPPDKLKLYMTSKHPALDFWQNVQYFDPRKASQFVEGVSESVREKLAQKCSGAIPQLELIKYREIRSTATFDNKFCPFIFWKSYSTEMPRLSIAASTALSVPPSSSQVERSFSSLKRILTPLRSSLTEENLAVHLQLAFHNATPPEDPVDDTEYEE